MSKEKQEETTNEVVVLENNNQVGELLQSGKLGDTLKGMSRVGFSLTSEYLDMEAGQTMRGIAVGLSSMQTERDVNGTKEMVDVECILIVGEDEKTYKAAQTVLVSELKKSNFPLPIEIICKGKVEMKGGKSYTDFDVFPLKLATKN